MRQEQPQWQDYKKLIANRARSFHQSSGVELAELICEGNLIFVVAAKKFDARRGAFSTLLYKSLENGLAQFCRRQRLQACWHLTVDGTLPDFGCCDRHERALYIRQSIAKLPAFGRLALAAFLERPQDFEAHNVERGHGGLLAVQNHMRAVGASWSAATATMRTLKCLAEEVI